MKIQKSAVLLSLMLILCIGITHAAGFIATFQPIRGDIYPDEYAVFNLTIKNYERVPDTFQVYSNEVAWSVETEPLLARIEAGEQQTVELKLIPNAWAYIGPQRLSVAVKSVNTDDKVTNDLPVYVKSWGMIGRDYVPSIEMQVVMQESIDPRSNIPVRVYLRNRNRLDITSLRMEFTSKLLNKVIELPLPPLDEKTEEVVFKIDDLTPPQSDVLAVTLYVNNDSVNQAKKNFEIIPYAELPVERDIKDEFFKKTEDIKIKNVGNIAKSKVFLYDTSLLRNLFTRATPRAQDYVEGNRRYLKWDFVLEPTEEYHMQVTVNYRPIIYALFAAVILIVVYFIYRSPVVAKKDMLLIGSPEQGFSEMKIILYIRNRSRDIIENIYVSDRVPALAEVMKESYLGTLEPSKMLHNDKKGTLIKWDIKTLEPFEERVLVYRIKSKLNILGGMRLPATKVSFETRNGRERTVFSNKCDINIR